MRIYLFALFLMLSLTLFISFNAVASCPDGTIESKFPSPDGTIKVVCLPKKMQSVILSVHDIPTKQLINTESYQINLCNEYADLSIKQYEKMIARGCKTNGKPWDDEPVWLDERKKYFDVCMNTTFDKEIALSIIEQRDGLLEHLCFSTEGDLESSGWCYELDPVLSNSDENRNGGKPWFESNIHFYGIIKNVGNKEWKSQEPGLVVMGAGRGYLFKSGNFSWGSPWRWRKPGEKWAVGPVSFGLSTLYGYQSSHDVYSTGLPTIDHPEDQNKSNNYSSVTWDKKLAQEFLEKADNPLIEKDGNMAKYKCKYQLGN